MSAQPQSGPELPYVEKPMEKQVDDLEDHPRLMIVKNESTPEDSQDQTQISMKVAAPSCETLDTAPSQGSTKMLSNQGGQPSSNRSSSRSSSRPSSNNKQVLPSSTAVQGMPQGLNLPQAQGENPSSSQNNAQQSQQNHRNDQQANRSNQPNQSRDGSRQGHLRFQPVHQTFKQDEQNDSNQPDQPHEVQQSQEGRPARNQRYANPRHGLSDSMPQPRPQLRNPQLFNPGPNGRFDYQHQAQFRISKLEVPTDAQIEFLKQLAAVEIPKAEMTLEELNEKEALRLKLQELCQNAICDYEVRRGKVFKKNSVALKCFGSLSNGFATKSSDMDLALVSPKLISDTSSTESEIPRLLEKVLLESGYGARLLTKTRVPIIKFCEKPTPELAKALLHEREIFEKERDLVNVKKDDVLKTQVAKESLENDVLTNDTTVSDPDESVQSITHSDQDGQVMRLEFKDNEKGDNAETRVHPNIGDHKVANGNQKPRSDEELVFLYQLAMQEGWYTDAGERQIIKGFVQAVQNSRSAAIDDGALDDARHALSALTDILWKYRPPPEKHLDFPKNGVGIQCDINFSNPLALHNTRLLRCYTLCDPRVRPLVLFVKAWAKRRKINSPYHGTLSSYGYVLMVLHYLANIVDPPVIPNLQTNRKAWQDKSPENAVLVDGYNVRFWRSEKEIKEYARRRMLTRNTQDGIGILICGFFNYYAVQNKFSPAGGFSWSQEVISLRTQGGTLQKKTKDWIGAKIVVEPAGSGQEPREIKHRYLLAIEDPFELSHNIARTVINAGIVSIRDEFRRAIFIIQKVGEGEANVEDLFAEAKERPTPPRRAFGPLPRTDNLDANGKEKPLLGMNSDEKSASGNKHLTAENGAEKKKAFGDLNVESKLTQVANGSSGMRRSKYSKRRIPSGRGPPYLSQASSHPSLSHQPSSTSSGINSQEQSRRSSRSPEPETSMSTDKVQISTISPANATPTVEKDELA